MKEERLKELLNKYYTGNSTLEEEEELRLYFTGSETGEEYLAEKEIFKGYSDILPQVTTDTYFTERIIRAVEKSDHLQGKTLLKRIIMFSGSAAAIFLIAAGSYFIFYSKEDKMTDTYSDPEIAYIEAMRVLNDVSAKLNKGTKALKPISKLYASANEGIRIVDTNTEKINLGLEKLGVLDKLGNGSQK